MHHNYKNDTGIAAALPLSAKNHFSGRIEKKKCEKVHDSKTLIFFIKLPLWEISVYSYPVTHSVYV